MDVRLPDGTLVTNVPEGTTQSELMRRLGKSAPPSQEWMAKTMANMTLADKPWYERAAIQMGAGVDDLVTGVKQLFASDKPEKLSDLVTNDTPLKRSQREVGQMRLLKKALAEASDTKTLPDWVPTGGSALQVAGEVLPTMAVPAGAYAQGARMLPRAVGLMRGAAAPARMGTGALIADAAIGGGVSGALTPTDENESRLMNTVMGAATGGIAPAVMSAARGGYRMMTQGGGQARAGQQIADALTEGAPDQARVLQQTIDRLNNARQGPIPLSTAAQLRDPQLARLEAGSRARNGANWYDFDQNQARAVASEFNKATSEAEQLAARRGTRKANWDTSWAGAQSAADTAKFAQDLPQFRKNLDVAMVSPEASNPATKAMLQAIADDIDRVTAAGVPYTPAHLQQIRANLSAKWHPANDNAFTKADRSSPARLSVMQEVDDILNATTGGKWQGVVDKYAANSRLVDAAKAAGRAREPFYDETGRVRKVSADAAGDVPKITESALGTAMDRGKGQFSSDAEARLNTILEALRAQNIVQGVKRSATAGGGSNTASDQFAAQTAGKVGDVIAGMAGGPAGAMTKGAIDKALDFANTHRDRALAEALQNPQRLAQILEQRLRSGQPLSATESGVLQILRGVPTATTLN